MMKQEDKDLFAAFVDAHGRGPSVGELMLLKEASASIALDKGDDIGTYAVENREVTTETGGYSVQGGSSADEDWRIVEIRRLRGLLRLSLDSAEKAWREGWDARDKLVGKVKSPSANDYNPYQVSDEEVGEE